MLMSNNRGFFVPPLFRPLSFWCFSGNMHTYVCSIYILFVETWWSSNTLQKPSWIYIHIIKHYAKVSMSGGWHQVFFQTLFSSVSNANIWLCNHSDCWNIRVSNRKRVCKRNFEFYISERSVHTVSCNSLTYILSFAFAFSARSIVHEW
jgi:hypothetical protein